MKKRALIVLDAQRAIVEKGDFSSQIRSIQALIDLFEQNGDALAFCQHIHLNEPCNPLYYKRVEDVGIVLDTKDHPVFTKHKPSAFSNPGFGAYLKAQAVQQLIIVGFNTEYCCLFTAIVGEHEGYEVIVIEDACGTVNDAATYEMPGLDIEDLVETILSWSGSVQVLYMEEFLGDTAQA